MIQQVVCMASTQIRSIAAAVVFELNLRPSTNKKVFPVKKKTRFLPGTSLFSAGDVSGEIKN